MSSCVYTEKESDWCLTILSDNVVQIVLSTITAAQMGYFIKKIVWVMPTCIVFLVENLIHFMFKHAVFMRSGKIMYICVDLFVNSANGEQKMGLFVSFLMIFDDLYWCLHGISCIKYHLHNDIIAKSLFVISILVTTW